VDQKQALAVAVGKTRQGYRHRFLAAAHAVDGKGAAVVRHLVDKRLQPLPGMLLQAEAAEFKLNETGLEVEVRITVDDLEQGFRRKIFRGGLFGQLGGVDHCRGWILRTGGPGCKNHTRIPKRPLSPPPGILICRTWTAASPAARFPTALLRRLPKTRLVKAD
jgi:hypothetical protein